MGMGEGTQGRGKGLGAGRRKRTGWVGGGRVTRGRKGIGWKNVTRIRIGEGEWEEEEWGWEKHERRKRKGEGRMEGKEIKEGEWEMVIGDDDGGERKKREKGIRKRVVTEGNEKVRRVKKAKGKITMENILWETDLWDEGEGMKSKGI